MQSKNRICELLKLDYVSLRQQPGTISRWWPYLWKLFWRENSTARACCWGVQSSCRSFVSHIPSLGFISAGLTPEPDCLLALTLTLLLLLLLWGHHQLTLAFWSIHCSLFFLHTALSQFHFPFSIFLILFSHSLTISTIVYFLPLLHNTKSEMGPPFFPCHHNITQLSVLLCNIASNSL